MTKIDDLKKRKDQIEARIQLMEARESLKQRKRRTRELIEIGGLAELAGLREFDRAAMLGALLYVRKLAEKDASKVKDWKGNGQTLLDARVAERKQRKEEK